MSCFKAIWNSGAASQYKGEMTAYNGAMVAFQSCMRLGEEVDALNSREGHGMRRGW